jgi:hypothetical protein
MDRPRLRSRLGWLLSSGCLLLAASCLLTEGCQSTPTARMQAQEEEREKELAEIKTVGDVTEVGNVSPLTVSGVGLVVGLAGTGGPAPPGYFRTLLEEELRKQGVKNAKKLVSSKDATDCAMVLVSALIPAGASKGDPLDIEVYLPQGSQATSLRGGYLWPCALRDFSTTKQINAQSSSERLLLGHVLARAQGAIVTNFGDEEDSGRKGHIWEGGYSLISRPFLLVLKNDQRFARVGARVSEQINLHFQDDPQRAQRLLERRRLWRLQQMKGSLVESEEEAADKTPPPLAEGVAKPYGKEAVVVRVPWGYRLNPERFLRVVRLIPLQEPAEARQRYRQKLQEMLQDPRQCVRAALRLEALGHGSEPLLKTGLQQAHPLVRFSAAEALAYLGNPAGAGELARLAQDYPVLRGYALLALASLNDPASRERLAELLDTPVPELRYGAFRALRLLDESDPHVQGALINHSFWLHQVPGQSGLLLHFTLGQRPEVVLFGGDPPLLPPFAVRAQEFTLRADGGEDRCTLCRFRLREGTQERRLCPLKLSAVLHALAELGGQYPDVVELLQNLKAVQAIGCPVRVNAIPELMPVEELAALGSNAAIWQGTSTAGAGAAPSPVASSPAAPGAR